MDWLAAPGYTVAREILERGIAAVYAVAFLVALRQFAPLLGQHGLLPVPEFVRYVPFRRSPSIFHWRYSDGALKAAASVGLVVSIALVLGIPESTLLPAALQPFQLGLTMACWLLLWVLYLSIVNVGQTFYGFGWETLLCEAGFLAAFLGSDGVAPPWLIILAFRWLAFRVEFGAGLIKLRGDECWRDLSCMDFHHETQPMPNPLSWYAHRLPRWFHRLEVIGNYVAQLLLPIALFLPQPIASIAALGMVATQAWLVLTGNYAWLNWLTMIVAFAGLSDGAFRAVHLPVAAADFGPIPAPFAAAVLALSAVVVVLSYWPARNLLSGRQAMNASFNPLHLVNTYGAFGSVSRVRDEVIVEGTLSERLPTGDWREYEFKGKPDEPARRPPQVAPYHLRLDWLMWFIPLSPAYADEWFLPFMSKLLEADPAILGLLRRDPFDGHRPRYVRARLFRYRFASDSERRETGHWWVREPIAELMPPARLRFGLATPEDEPGEPITFRPGARAHGGGR